MARTITLIHEDGGFDLLAAEDLGEAESLGTRTVLTRDGEQERHKVALPHLTETVLQLPDSYPHDENCPEGCVDGHSQALVHLVQTLTDRHSSQDKITEVRGDDVIGPKLAVLLDASFTAVEA